MVWLLKVGTSLDSQQQVPNQVGVASMQELHHNMPINQVFSNLVQSPSLEGLAVEQAVFLALRN